MILALILSPVLSASAFSGETVGHSMAHGVDEVGGCKVAHVTGAVVQKLGGHGGQVRGETVGS